MEEKIITREELRLLKVESRMETIEWMVSIVLYAAIFYALYCFTHRVMEDGDWISFIKNL